MNGLPACRSRPEQERANNGQSKDFSHQFGTG